MSDLEIENAVDDEAKSRKRKYQSRSIKEKLDVVDYAKKNQTMPPPSTSKLTGRGFKIWRKQDWRLHEIFAGIFSFFFAIFFLFFCKVFFAIFFHLYRRPTCVGMRHSRPE
jgi:hypothetical protein